MDINNTVETEGIVLKETRYKESSKIVEILTKSRGRINIFVSGALRPKNQLMLVTEKFVESKFTLEQNKNKFYIKKADVINSNLEIGNNPRNFLIGELICELLLMTMPENLVDEIIYNLTTRTFDILREDNINSDLVKTGFLIKYISLLGFKPNFNGCTVCEKRYLKNIYFSKTHGGLICENCLEIIEDYDKLNKIEFEILFKLLYTKYEDYKNINYDLKSLKKIDEIIYNYVIYNTELSGLESRNKYEKLFGI